MNKKPEKPRTRKAPATASDPIFAAIGEHLALSKKTERLEDAMRIARDSAEKRRRGSLKGKELLIAAAEDTTLEYDQFNCAANAERKAAIRMARTTPTTPSGMAALISHVRRALKTEREVDWEDWVPPALRTVASALARMEPMRTLGKE